MDCEAGEVMVDCKTEYVGKCFITPPHVFTDNREIRGVICGMDITKTLWIGVIDFPLELDGDVFIIDLDMIDTGIVMICV